MPAKSVSVHKSTEVSHPSTAIRFMSIRAHPLWIFCGVCGLKMDITWRIIPGLGYVVNNHDDCKSP